MAHHSSRSRPCQGPERSSSSSITFDRAPPPSPITTTKTPAHSTLRILQALRSPTQQSFTHHFRLTIGQFSCPYVVLFNLASHNLVAKHLTFKMSNNLSLGFSEHGSSFNEPAKKGELLTHLLPFHSDSSVTRTFQQVDHRNNALVPMSSSPNSLPATSSLHISAFKMPDRFLLGLMARVIA